LNLDTPIESQLVKLNIDLYLLTTAKAKSLFQKYKDVFSCSYKDLKGIPLHIAQYWIELDTTISPSHQNPYRMNPNYVAIIKQDLDKLLTPRFIVVMEKVTWLSPIVVVSKKTNKLRICINFKILNANMKKDPYLLPFMKQVLDMVDGHKVYSFLKGFFDYH